MSDGNFTIPQQNFLDRAISLISPEAGLRRLRAKTNMARVEAFNGGATQSRRNWRRWNTSKGDANTDSLPDLQKLRESCRDLTRNYALAGGAINTKVTNVVGGGIRPQSKIDADFLGMSYEKADAWQKQTEREFALWAESSNCDIERCDNFYGLQNLAFRSMLENGDVFCNLPYKGIPGFPYELRLQLIEADRISNPENFADGQNNIWGGVERDEYGAPVAYHVSNEHPGTMNTLGTMKWARMPVFGERSGRRNILHVYRKLRIGQSRGLPDLSAVIEPLKQLQQYTEAEMAAAVISGCYTVFITTANGEGPDFPTVDTVQGAPWMSPGGEYRPSVDMGERTAAMKPGAQINLLPDEKVEFADPGRPNTAFDPFVQAILRQIGVGLELPFEVLVKHFTASYSAARAALLEAWRYYLTTRQWFVGSFCQAVYEEWLTEAVMSGRVIAPGFLTDPAIKQAYCRAMWVGPGRGQINPQAETAAAIARIETGWSTREKECLEMDGSDWDMVHAQLVQEQRKMVAGKLVLAVDAELKAEKEIAKQQKDQNSGDSSTDAKD